MSSRFSYVVLIALVFAALVAAVYVYPLLPEQIASHWDTSGRVNGTMGKLWGVLLLPVILAAVSALLFVLPRIDPLKKNIAEFRREYNLMIVSLALFLAYVYALTLVWNMGNHFDMGRLIVPGVGALFVILGLILPRTKRNWFIGIRTPWTLSSDNVWLKTHRIGGALFVAIGLLISLCSIVNPAYAFPVLIAGVLAASIGSIVYSYILYRREEQKP